MSGTVRAISSDAASHPIDQVVRRQIARGKEAEAPPIKVPSTVAR